ncbi:choline/ethanolamine kinase family protein [Microbulbifer sediminum]|uniref:choline/ethanolamine kinase family protein n=1 Tax=Microbulbifer sediminum TaxID=2904250 RepID=UPI001F2A4A03|nr:choline/ethanolamine kinase family protein [Microbulbifer sediminum]
MRMTDNTRVSADIIPADWEHWSSVPPTVLSPLTGGLTNRSYLLASGNDRLVLRKNSPISDTLDLDRRAEAMAMQHADRSGLCAPLVYCDPGHRYLVTRFIDGESWHRQDHGALRQLAKLLRSIHRLPSIGAHLDIETKVASYRESIDTHAEFYPQLQALDARIKGHLEDARLLADGYRLCHNDLSPANLIDTPGGGLYAIDWEYAAMGDPFYDLAVIVEEHAFNEQQRRLLLEEYLEREVQREDAQRLEHWSAIYGYLSMLWYAVQWSSGQVAPHIKDEILARARRFLTA